MKIQRLRRVLKLKESAQRSLKAQYVEAANALAELQQQLSTLVDSQQQTGLTELNAPLDPQLLRMRQHFSRSLIHVIEQQRNVCYHYEMQLQAAQEQVDKAAREVRTFELALEKCSLDHKRQEIKRQARAQLPRRPSML